MYTFGRSLGTSFSTLQERLMRDAHAQWAMYEQMERAVGGRALLEALEAQNSVKKLIEEAARPELAFIRENEALMSGFTFACDTLGMATGQSFARQAAGIWEGASAGEAIRQSAQRMATETTGVRALRLAAEQVGTHSAIAEIQKQAIEHATYRDLVKEMGSLDTVFADAVRSISTSLPVESLWRNLAKVQEPWILAENPYRSFEAFGALSEIAQTVARTQSELRALATFAPTYPAGLAALEEEEDGVDPRIDDLPANAIQPLARAAGLRLHTVEARADTSAPKNLGIVVLGSGTWDREAHNQVQAVEVMLRFELDTRLTVLLGSNWYKHRVDKQVLAGWRSKQFEARVGQSESLLDFSTFGELRDVLLRGDVWGPCFVDDVMMTKEEVTIALDRLMEIRHAVDHGRQLTRRHFIWCFAEVDRVLQAFGVEATPEDDFNA